MLSLSLTGFGCRAADAMYNNSVSFKEALERLAEDRGLLMLPKPGKQQNGKQVWLYFIHRFHRASSSSATSVCDLTLLVYATLTYYCMRP
jgi:hypothetical protein